MDRGGTFLGKLTLSGPRVSTWDLGLSLLEAGLGKLHPSFDADRVAGGRTLQQAQEKAQSERLKVRGPAPVAGYGVLIEGGHCLRSMLCGAGQMLQRTQHRAISNGRLEQ